MKISKLARTLKQGKNISGFSDIDNAAGVPLVRETGVDVHVKLEIKHGIFTKVVKKGEAHGILLHDSVGSVEVLQEQLKTAPEDSKKEGGW